ncbi:hypothetical protein [Comamonas sp. NLF-1-9]|uniref:hypothetical protein n=1 Tax=Comamonas sp. NLF-1-9 TaxID=2853163 RepID=UPI001C438EC5|nr:hypothetical protein [Comamonas sp. NLF-1-9]QXL83253.1 hypothetical protein KUD94_08195 [Comamonas sp. NLF-1-9]
MLNLKLGLSALLLEGGAWSVAVLWREHSDAALASYLVMHLAASVLLALLLFPFLPRRIAHPRWAAVLLIAACSYTIPVAGFAGVLVAFVVLRVYRAKKVRDDFETLLLPEFDQHQRVPRVFRHTGMRSFLSNSGIPVQSRMGAMSALRYVPERTASPLLRTVLEDSSEDLRLLAYGMLDNLEKRINHSIAQESDALRAMHLYDAHDPRVLECVRRLSDLYWELVYQELAQGDLRDYAMQQSLKYCDRVLEVETDDGAMHLRRGRLLHGQKDVEGAAREYARAIELGLPAARVLPYQAQLHFELEQHAQVRALLGELGRWAVLARLRPIIDLWTRAS